MQEKPRKGLCFHCNEKFGPDHRCKRRELQVLWVMDEEEIEGDRDCQQVSIAMAELQGKFSDIFATPSGLPLVRERDHAIVLEGGGFTYLSKTLPIPSNYEE